MNNVFIYGDINSKKETLLRAFIEVFSNKENTLLILVDPKKIEFEDLKDRSYYKYILHDCEDLINKFSIIKNLDTKIVIIVNELADFIYNDKCYNDLRKMFLFINKSLTINYIVCTQRNIDEREYANKLEFIIKNDNVTKFLF